MIWDIDLIPAQVYTTNDPATWRNNSFETARLEFLLCMQ